MKEIALQTGLGQVDQVEEAVRLWNASIEEEDEAFSEIVRNLFVLRKDVKVLVDELRAGLHQGRRSSGGELDVDLGRMEREQLAFELKRLKQEKVNADQKVQPSCPPLLPPPSAAAAAPPPPLSSLPT